MTRPPCSPSSTTSRRSARSLSETLTRGGVPHRLLFARDRVRGRAGPRHPPDVCLVDLGLPDRDGLALVHRLALESGAAIIIISGRAQVQDRVTGLELGADDYIIKPFDPAEVVARIRARLRQPKSAGQSHDTARFQRLDRAFRPLPPDRRGRARGQLFPCRGRGAAPVPPRHPSA